jgi:cellulose synthase/poly-beta-1,6-N-acetylglucosamine synthase-like glycosyltransferase
MNQPNHYYIPQMHSIAERINNPPRLVQAIQCHNEEEFIEHTLASIYDEVDQIIVVEGAVKNRPNSTEDGHSTDRTAAIINYFKETRDPYNKVLFIQISQPFENLEALKQTFVDLVNPGDWLIINDADEFYRPEDIRRLRVAIDRYPHICEFVPVFLHFYGDFNHIAVPGPEWQPQHQRVFQVVQGMKYHSLRS